MLVPGWIRRCFFALLLVAPGAVFSQAGKTAPGRQWTAGFRLTSCDFAPAGRLEYFILEPGYRLILEGREKQPVRLIVTVMPETRNVAGIETRVVEEREYHAGKLAEVSRNFLAICKQNGGLFYFGEEVDIYRDGKIVSHEGSWRAGEKNYKAGLLMPGLPLLGARYYQEVAPGMAMDRAEILALDAVVKTAAGKFDRCLKVEETTPLEPGTKEYKWYAPGIGLVRDGNLYLVQYGPKH